MVIKLMTYQCICLLGLVDFILILTHLINQGLNVARSAECQIVVLVGDEAYYGRFGFKRIDQGRILFPGPVNPKRLLCLCLKDDALSNFQGMVIGI